MYPTFHSSEHGTESEGGLPSTIDIWPVQSENAESRNFQMKTCPDTCSGHSLEVFTCVSHICESHTIELDRLIRFQQLPSQLSINQPHTRSYQGIRSSADCGAATKRKELGCTSHVPHGAYLPSQCQGQFRHELPVHPGIQKKLLETKSVRRYKSRERVSQVDPVAVGRIPEIVDVTMLEEHSQLCGVFGTCLRRRDLFPTLQGQ